MTPPQIKEARLSLGLTQSKLSRLLDTDPTTIRRMEMDADKASFRKPAPRMARLIEAYLNGYRPDDWPDTIDGKGFPR